MAGEGKAGHWLRIKTAYEGYHFAIISLLVRPLMGDGRLSSPVPSKVISNEDE
jgi:hypothetical protein